jgi:hypothetical protein
MLADPDVAAELAVARERIERLQHECRRLDMHARNLDREVLRLRRTARRPAAAAPDQSDALYWRRRYEDVVSSLSWRLMWWVGTPYRFLVERHRSRLRARRGAGSQP